MKINLSQSCKRKEEENLCKLGLRILRCMTKTVVDKEETDKLGFIRISNFEDFSGSAVVRTLRFHCRGTGLIPGQGTK